MSRDFEPASIISDTSLGDVQEPFSTMDIEPPRFPTFDSSSFSKLVKMKDHEWLRDHGGVEGIVSELETDMENGISGDQVDLDNRRRTFGSNFYPEKELFKCFCNSSMESLKDPLILILIILAVLSIGFGIKKNGLREGWQEGITKLIAILFVVTVAALSNFWPVSQCLRFSKQSSNIPLVDVVRSGQWRQIKISRIVVGDIVFLKPGDQIPGDGLFVEGSPLQLAELKTDGRLDFVPVNSQENPFIPSGSMVANGYARMLVTSVGNHKKNHEILLNGRLIDEIKQLTLQIHKIGQAVAFLTFFVLLARFFAGLILNENENKVPLSGKSDILIQLIGIVGTAATIALTSNPEGLLLAAQITLAYSMRRLMLAGNLVRQPSLCHSVASATTICINKTALTKDSKEVTRFWLGLSSIEEVPHNLIAPNVLELLHQGIGLNTTQPSSKSSFTTPSNSTEQAIFDWGARHLGLDIGTLKRSYTILEIEPFNSDTMRSGVLISKNDDNTIHVHRKGAPEFIMSMCSHYYETTGIVKAINRSSRMLLEQILKSMTEKGLRCIAFAHRKTSIRDYFTFSRQQLILLGLVGLADDRRSGVKKTLEHIQQAGLNIKLITGDDVLSAKAMAISCGLLKSNCQEGEVLRGDQFYRYSPQERMERVDSIQVLARATPMAKFLLVQCLKQKGHVVAFLGHGIGDISAIKAADVGLCFGTRGAEMAKATSGIILQNQDFPSLLDIMKWGRGIYDGVLVYTQFLLTATVVALVVDFVMTVSAGETPGFDAIKVVTSGKIPYPTCQLLWMKLIMSTLAAVALIIKQPSGDLMHKPPRNQDEPIMTNFITRNICTLAFYQISILLMIHFRGSTLFKVNAIEKDTMILNTYVLCQVFTMISAKLSQMNIFEDIHNTAFLWPIIGIILAVQALIVEILENFAGTTRLDWRLWGICVSVAAASLPISWIGMWLSAIGKPSFRRLKFLNLKDKTE